MEKSSQYMALLRMEKIVNEMVNSENTLRKIEHVELMWKAFDLGKQRERRNYMMEAEK
jgi:hypothetical protein